jgi:hypothetical protein
VVRTAATTAVIAGTAGAVRHHQDQKYAQQDYNQQMAYQQQQMAQQQAYQQQMQDSAPVEEEAAVGITAQLKELAQLHKDGILTDDEFAAAKQKLLAG